MAGEPEVLRTLAEKVDPRHAAVIVIDVQNYFCHPEGGMAKGGAQVAPLTSMVPRLSTLIDAARAAGALVVFVQLIHAEFTTSPARWEQFLRRGPETKEDRLFCRDGTWEADFYLLSPQPGEPIVKKHRYSAFIDTDLDLILRSRGIQTLIMTGVSTHVCVESTARDGFMKDYYVVFVDDCTACTDPERHRTTLANIEDLFGVVSRADDVIEAWSEVTAPAAAG